MRFTQSLTRKSSRTILIIVLSCCLFALSGVGAFLLLCQWWVCTAGDNRVFERIENVPENEVGLVQLMDVGLMPLEDSEWALGKCGFKMLSYMAAGLPVVVSPVGVNAEILSRAELGFAATSPADWFEAFERLYRDRELGKRLGANGRRVVEEHYSVKTNVLKLAEIFREVSQS